MGNYEGENFMRWIPSWGLIAPRVCFKLLFIHFVMDNLVIDTLDEVWWCIMYVVCLIDNVAPISETRKKLNDKPD